MTDLEIGRYAVRTFRLDGGRPESLMSSMGVGNWRGGVCQARCLACLANPANPDPWAMLLGPRYTVHYGPRAPMTFSINAAYEPPGWGHPAPQLNCTCGIYGSLTLEHLVRQYPTRAAALVTIIAAEGNTIIGSRGLRTEFARVVAYCLPNVGWISRALHMATARERAGVARAFPDAKAFATPEDMCWDYGIALSAPPSSEAEQRRQAALPNMDFWREGETERDSA